MAQEQLKTVAGTGTQTTTQTPQAAGTSGGSTTTASGVQPGTATSLLNTTSGGVALKSTPLSVVGLGSRKDTATTQVTASEPAHQTSPILFGFSILLFVIAIAMFWATTRTAKSTT